MGVESACERSSLVIVENTNLRTALKRTGNVNLQTVGGGMSYITRSSARSNRVAAFGFCNLGVACGYIIDLPTLF